MLKDAAFLDHQNLDRIYKEMTSVFGLLANSDLIFVSLGRLATRFQGFFMLDEVLPVGVRPTRCFYNLTRLEEQIEACECVNLKNAAELGQMGLRMNTFAVPGVGKPDVIGQSTTLTPCS